MPLTEEQARAKWCPLSRTHIGAVHGAGNVAINRSASPLKEVNCIASACMAWRRGPRIGIGPSGERRDRDLDGRTKWTDTGYCGAFGDETARGDER